MVKMHSLTKDIFVLLKFVGFGMQEDRIERVTKSTATAMSTAIDAMTLLAALLNCHCH